MKVIWSEFAEKQLDEIFDHYAKESSLSIAAKLIRQIIKVPNKLKRAPFIGQVEEFLKDRPIVYRYLVFKNYKIIYSVEEKNKLIKIADVFDTRQNPSKIKRSNKKIYLEKCNPALAGRLHKAPILLVFKSN